MVIDGGMAVAARDIQVAEVKSLLDRDVLLKTSRVESHLGRELTRHISLLRTLQAERRRHINRE